ncbi:hypothetical protein RP20_CCG006167 [Aedes albopictus]|nr:hypothetical protein RP20_CCG006167 [Aedes albopictus]
MPEMKSFSVFAREKHVYEQTLPAMEQLWAEAGESVRFGPRCWKTVEGDTDIIVLDDLGDEGYSVANRQEGVGMEHVHVLLEKLAKFHAAGAVLYRKHGRTTPLYDCMLIDPAGKDFMDQYYKVIKPEFYGILSSTPEDERYKAKLEKSMENDFEKTTAALTFDDSDFVTICHADMWTNNHMYSYHTSGTPKDALLVIFSGLFDNYSSTHVHIFHFRSTTKAPSTGPPCRICSTIS